MWTTAPLASGTEVELEVPPGAAGRTLRGRLVREGRPLDVPCTVRVGFDWLRTPGGGALFEEGESRSIAAGANFELDHVPLRAFGRHAWIEVRYGEERQRMAIETVSDTDPIELRWD